MTMKTAVERIFEEQEGSVRPVSGGIVVSDYEKITEYNIIANPKEEGGFLVATFEYNISPDGSVLYRSPFDTIEDAEDFVHVAIAAGPDVAVGKIVIPVERLLPINPEGF